MEPGAHFWHWNDNYIKYLKEQEEKKCVDCGKVVHEPMSIGESVGQRVVAKESGVVTWLTYIINYWP
jgi:hypothetical protein